LTQKEASTSRLRRLVGQILLVWLVLLAASHLTRWMQDEPGPLDDQRVRMVALEPGATPVRMAFLDSQPVSTPAAVPTALPVIIVLHGSPVASRSLRALHKELSDGGRFRVITPDLPGFGGSTRHIKDYSIAAHAKYLLALQDSLGIARSHLVGYSMGGGVAIEAAHAAPRRMASLQLLSSIGVQELELMGEYHLNRAVHALQLAAIWTVSELVPHFGWFDDAILGMSYARNFYDTDQRPLRDHLSCWDGPMQIIHGKDDPLVPFEAALEHHRLVPQSELVGLEAHGHGLPFQEAEMTARYIGEFVARVERREAPTRATAEENRVRASRLPFDAANVPPSSGFGLFVLVVLIIFVSFISEDLSAIGAGLLAARGTISIEIALLAAFLGIVIGDVGLYAAGRLLGRRLLTIPPFSWMLKESQLERGASWFCEKGPHVILASRFVPGTRLPTYVAAGLLRTPFWVFLGYFLAAAVVWTPLITGLSAWAGMGIFDFYAAYEAYALWILVILVAVLYVSIHVGIPLTTHNGRRRLLSRWHRISRWEFWPAYIFYAPIAVWILILAIRHRSLTLFTAANPGMFTGGFLGERKQDILGLLSHSEDHVATWRLIPSTAGNRTERVLAFMEQHGLSYPIVLKPDVGERGQGVWIARSRADIEHYFSHNNGDIIAQEFVDGLELGIFYIREPGQSVGWIFSVTEKRPVWLRADGRRTLERLILDDDRAVSMAPLFMKRFSSDLGHVFEEGTRIPLAEVGTHCRGALFLDGSLHMSPALSETIDRISRQTDGFFFGRYDVRVPDPGRLVHGDGFKILELNGVSSEATHIYDPDTSLIRAWLTLMNQWMLAFRIGSANRQQGVQPDGIGNIWRTLREARKRDTALTNPAARTSSAISDS